MNNTYVIGDVHGCYYTLLELVSKLPKNSELIFVGDLCDRGLHSKEVIEFVKSNNHKCIKGNHEYYMLEHLLYESEPRWLTKEYMGGKETMQSYEGKDKLLEEHLQWMQNLPNYILTDNYFITHAFCLPYFKRRDNKTVEHAMMVNRLNDKEEWGHDWEDGYEEYEVINIFGHDDYDEVQKGKNYIAIDTGCVYGNKLTALELGSMRVYQQDVLKRDVAL
jgi:serine/threonine protein phosphatase 1